jgi:hypothetical protein
MSCLSHNTLPVGLIKLKKEVSGKKPDTSGPKVPRFAKTAFNHDLKFLLRMWGRLFVY